MKSIIQEASSIAKAVEQAWAYAGQPAEFTIKILEMPHKNFLGFTTRAAKVAFFFDLHPSLKTPSLAPKPKHKAPPRKVDTSKAVQAPALKTPPERELPKPKPVSPFKREYKPLWNPAMIKYVQEWVQETLNIMNLSNITFSVEPSNFHLRITFNQKVLSETAQEKKLFASFACLIIESLKRTFKTGFRGHKIVLLHAPHDDTQSR